ncbi:MULTISPECIES: methionine ABC transporter permease [unclassified Campylobacter]|uniref:methionine ABC transporter permease n=1 Tax=unclassified Campylobacter TaxID=2593542 RepID=UPI001237F979|nr:MULTISPECIES: methionine ABC transporter permease [unclassified Campylobacter]KAA6226353.1 ABC transporter permease [Campylobacter sp. LR286c]KAA6226609.1 ABC transporter permease [Campylobacter sp. LR185c]KAA6226845.1 ABC transporter permease [Campylobacter sp. LR196d]KAA6230282.1 ABC transporter permease [Campylobacter sp. LR291e]KAA6233803.1 ABC transporter permease [Campylobacter sp. LR264d]
MENNFSEIWVNFKERIANFIDEFSFEGIKEVSINSIKTFPQNYENILKLALEETIYMSLVSVIVGFILAIIPGILLAIWGKDGISENKIAYNILDFITNILRAFPFLILIVVLLPLSKIIVGTSIGTNAAIVPLSIGVAPFLAKMLESAFKEVDKGVIEAAKSYGASNFQIIFRVIFIESMPSIISGVTLVFIFTIGFSALAGTVGGGGLGDVAIRYGYERFNQEVMIQTVVILLILVQIVQILGNLFYMWAKNSKTMLSLIVLSLLVLFKFILELSNDESPILMSVLLFFLVLSLLFRLRKFKA